MLAKTMKEVALAAPSAAPSPKDPPRLAGPLALFLERSSLFIKFEQLASPLAAPRAFSAPPLLDSSPDAPLSDPAFVSRSEGSAPRPVRDAVPPTPGALKPAINLSDASGPGGKARTAESIGRRAHFLGQVSPGCRRPSVQIIEALGSPTRTEIFPTSFVLRSRLPMRSLIPSSIRIPMPSSGSTSTRRRGFLGQISKEAAAPAQGRPSTPAGAADSEAQPPANAGESPEGEPLQRCLAPASVWSGAVAQRAPRSSAVSPPFSVERCSAAGRRPSQEEDAPRPEGSPDAAQSGPAFGPSSRPGRRNDSPTGGATSGSAPSGGCVSPVLPDIMDAPCPVRAAPVITLMDHNGAI